MDSLLLFCQKSYPVPLFNLDRSTLQHLNEAIMMNKSMRMVTVYDRDVIFERSAIRDEFVKSSVESWKMISGSIEYDGVNIGKIELLFDESVIHKSIVTSVISTIISTFSIVAFLLVILYYFARIILVKPIVTLSETAKIVAEKNDYSIRVASPHVSDDEMGILYRGFNFMLENIQHRDVELFKTGAYLHDIIESMPSMLITLDDEYRVGLWNHSAEIEIGIKSEDIVGCILTEKTAVLDDYIRDIDKVFRTGRSAGFFHREFCNSENAKSKNYKNFFIYPLSGEGIKGVVIRIDDITEFEKIETQLRQIQKMETLGTIAGGIAHDFNNMLGGIIGTLSLIKYRMKKGRIDDFTDYINTMEDSALRARDVASQLLTLSRQQESRFQIIDLSKSLGHVLRICENTFNKCITIECRIDDEPAIVQGDETQLQQVFLNLCVNAMHAMTIMRPDDEIQGGTLSVSLDKIHADRFFRVKHTESSEIDYWMVSVADKGVGMSKSTIDKIFEPFYTTKTDMRGTGLGLSVVNSIVKQHGGYIDVYSEPGTGSSFKIYLPLFSPDEDLTSSARDEVLSGGTGLVLVIDDEESIRDLTREMLVE